MALGNWTAGDIVDITYGEYDSRYTGTFVVLKDVNLDEYMLAYAKTYDGYAYGVEQAMINADIIKHIEVNGFLDIGSYSEVSGTTSAQGEIDSSEVIEAVYGNKGKPGTFASLFD